MKKLLFSIGIMLLLFGCSEKSVPNYDFDVNKDYSLSRDKISKAKFVDCLDATTFTFEIEDEIIDVKLIGISTPKYNHHLYGNDPWGKEAFEYSCKALNDADEVLLELDTKGDFFDSGKLQAWIWVDEELLNYNMVFNGYANIIEMYKNYKYYELLENALVEAKINEKGIHVDSPTNYTDTSGAEIRNLSTITKDDVGKLIKVQGVVAIKIGLDFFLEQDEIRIFVKTYDFEYTKIKETHRVEFYCYVEEYFGNIVLTNIVNKKIVSISKGNEVTSSVIIQNKAEMLMKLNQRVIIEKLEIKEVSQELMGIVVKTTKEEDQINLFIPNGVTDIYLEDFIVGDSIHVVGSVFIHDSDYVLMLSSINDILTK